MTQLNKLKLLLKYYNVLCIVSMTITVLIFVCSVITNFENKGILICFTMSAAIMMLSIIVHDNILIKFNTKKFYDVMCKMEDDKSFEVLHDNWYSCFNNMLSSMGFNKKSINRLFYEFEMCNWTDLRLENSEYKDYSKEQLIDRFCGECHYICDRYNFDRIFRAHWLFYKAFNTEMDKIRFP